MKQKVVVTGIGMVSPCGNGKEATWSAIKAGKSGITRITKFDPSRCTCQIAGEVKGFDEYAEAAGYLDRKAARHLALFCKYAVASAREAWADAGFTDDNRPDMSRVATIIGNGIGGMDINTVGFKVPMNTLEGTFPGKVKSLDGKTFDIPEMSYAPPAGGGHWEQKEFTLFEGESVFDAWSATLVIGPAKFADVVEGAVIRVYYKDKGSDYLPIFKHVSDWNDWSALQDIKKEYDGFFETTVPADAIDELKSDGLRFQGLGFTITSVILSQNMWIDEGGEEPQKEETIWDTETVFDSWSATIVIDAAKFAKAKDGNTIRVFIKDKGDDYNAIFKHVGDWNDWTEFQSIKKDTDEYFESTVTEAVLEELQSAGLRFQGLGFTIVEVHLIP